MENAGHEFASFISNVELNDASIPVITNVDAEPTVNSSDFREKMPKQIYSSVHWTQTIEKMVSDGVEIFIEIGPGKVLAGLNKKIAVFTMCDTAILHIGKSCYCNLAFTSCKVASPSVSSSLNNSAIGIIRSTSPTDCPAIIEP